ncbi:helix-turn-helix domain-containing protein, partial [Aeromonas veronii]
QGATVDQGMIVSLFPVNAIWVNSYMIGAIATFERELMLERQAEGIAMAKQRGVYKGRKPTAMAKGEEVLSLAERGLAKAEIARRTGISLSSVQRILRGLSGE